MRKYIHIPRYIYVCIWTHTLWTHKLMRSTKCRQLISQPLCPLTHTYTYKFTHTYTLSYLFTTFLFRFYVIALFYTLLPFARTQFRQIRPFKADLNLHAGTFGCTFQPFRLSHVALNTQFFVFADYLAFKYAV